MQKDEFKKHVTAKSTWLHGFFILLFAVIYSLAKILVVAVVVFQFLATLITGKRNERLLEFGQSLSTFMYQILCYLTFNSDEKPYPFGEWPKGEPVSAAPAPAPAKPKRKAVARRRKAPAKPQKEGGDGGEKPPEDST